MKATGIVRRIDDLGRVVIPKEIRRTLRIREADPLEIFTDREGEIILKKYSPIGEMSTFAKQYAESLAQVSGHIAMISDRDQFIAVAGGMKNFLTRNISSELEEIIENRENYVAAPDIKALYPLKDSDREAGIAYPIIGGGDVAGAVVLMLNTNGVMPSQTEIKLVSVAASFLGKQTEE